MPFERGAGVFLCGFVIGELYGGITIFFYRTELRNNTRTSLNNGAWNIFPSAPKTEVIPIFFQLIQALV